MSERRPEVKGVLNGIDSGGKGRPKEVLGRRRWKAEARAEKYREGRSAVKRGEAGEPEFGRWGPGA